MTDAPKPDRTKIIHELMQTWKGREQLIASMTDHVLIGVRYRALTARWHEDPELNITPQGIPTTKTYPLPLPPTPDKSARAADKAMSQVTTALYQMVDEACLAALQPYLAPKTAKMPEGDYDVVLVNARTFAQMRKDGVCPSPKDTGLLVDPGPGLFYRGARIRTSRLVEPGVLIAMGEPEEIGKHNMALRLQDASETVKDLKRTPKLFGIAATLALRLETLQNPLVGAYTYP